MNKFNEFKKRLIKSRAFLTYLLSYSLSFRLFILTLSLTFSLTLCLHAAGWPLFRGTSDRTGAIIERAEPILTPAWYFQYGPGAANSFQIMGSIVSSPVVYKGILYFGGRDNSVWALDALTGAQLWQYNTGDWVDATPCVSADAVFVPCRDKYFYAFDRLTGELKWPPVYTGSMDCSSPVLYKGKLYFLSGNPGKCLNIVDAQTGQLNQVNVSQFGFSSPVIKNNLLFFGTNDGLFQCYTIGDNGNVAFSWNRQTEGGIYYSTLTADDNSVYAVSGDDERKLFSLNPANGAIIRKSIELNDKRASVSSVSIGEGKIFVASSSGTTLWLHAFSTALLNTPVADPNDPVNAVAPDWSAQIGIPHETGIVSSPAIADGTVYIGSGDGCLYCLNAANGQFIDPGTGAPNGTTPVGRYLSYEDTISSGIVSSPTVSNGMVYVGTYDGQVWAFKAGKITSIAYPDNSETIVNQAQVQGTVKDTAVTSYKLEYGSGENPAQWTDIVNGTAAVIDGTLGDWNASGLSDGIYTLKLTVNGDAANRAINRVIVDNPPLPPSSLKVEDTPFDGGGSLSLDWNLSGDDGSGDNDVTAYKIYKSTYAGGYAYLTEVTKGSTGYVDTACPAQATYYYVVTAYDHSSESVYSNSAGAFSIVDGFEILPAAGGTVPFNFNGTLTEVVIEPNTFDQKVWVGIRVPADPPNSGKPANSKDTNINREFGVTPANAVFLKPITIKIPYRAPEITGMNKENLRIYWWDDLKKLWRVVNTSDPLSEDGRVWARIPHFSLYRIMEYTAGLEELITDDKTYTFPNPAKEDKLYFKFYLGSKADVTIDVYNVAGEIVAHLEKAGCPAGIVSEQEWSIGSIASGVYIYRIEAKTPSASKAIKKKLAIIH